MGKNSHEMLGFWGALVGALISGVFATCIFIRERSLSKMQESKEIISFGMLYINSVEIMQQYYAVKQIDFIQAYIDGCKINKFQPQKLNVIEADDYMKRLSDFDIQKISQLYIELDRDTKFLILLITNLDFVKNQLENLKRDARSTSNTSIDYAQNLVSIYSDVYKKNNKLLSPARIENLVQIRMILAEVDYFSETIQLVDNYLQKIENGNNAIVQTFPNEIEKLTNVMASIENEISILKRSIYERYGIKIDSNL